MPSRYCGLVTSEDTHEAATAAGYGQGRGIFDGFSGYATPTDDEWREVFTAGTVAVDTNILLNLYRYNQKAQRSLLEALGKLGNQLWVPNQVMVEFWRNRESAIEDPDRQLRSSADALRKDLDKAITNLRQWVNRVSLDRAGAGKLESLLSTAFDEVITEMEVVVNGSGRGIERDTSKDEILSLIAELLDGKVGPPLDFEEHAQCTAEAKRRNEARIPPGYEDKKKEGRGGDLEAGDYLVWFQLIQECKNRQRDILFVTGDVKEDWWRLRNGKPLGPRNELAEELQAQAGVRLYMLKPDQFLVHARKFLEVTVSENSVQNVELVDARTSAENLGIQEQINMVVAAVRSAVRSSVHPLVSAAAAQAALSIDPLIKESDWYGTGSFRSFLALHLGDLVYEPSPPGYVFDPERHSASDIPGGEKKELEPLLRRICSKTGVPGLPTNAYRTLFRALAEDLAQYPLILTDTSKRVRDRTESLGTSVPRNAIAFVIKGLGYAGRPLDSSVSAEGLADAWVHNILTRCAFAEIPLADEDRIAIRAWIAGSVEDEEG